MYKFTLLFSNLIDCCHYSIKWTILICTIGNCNGGGFLSVKECFQWDRVPSILLMRTKSQGNWSDSVHLFPS